MHEEIVRPFSARFAYSDSEIESRIPLFTLTETSASQVNFGGD